MTSISLHPAPALRTVMQEQFHAVGLRLRKHGIYLLVVLSVLTLFDLMLASRETRLWLFPSGYVTIDAQVPSIVSIVALPLFWLVGLFAPSRVWEDEEPLRRSYHWSMPVTNGMHTLVKMLSGWTWLIIAVAIYCLWMCALNAFVSDSNSAQEFMGRLVTSLFTAASVIYLLSSIAAIGSNHPWRWIAGVFIIYFVSITHIYAPRMLGLRSVQALQSVFASLFTGDYGLGAAIAPGENQMQWLTTTLLWMIIGCLGVWVAAYRRGRT